MKLPGICTDSGGDGGLHALIEYLLLFFEQVLGNIITYLIATYSIRYLPDEFCKCYDSGSIIEQTPSRILHITELFLLN